VSRSDIAAVWREMSLHSFPLCHDDLELGDLCAVLADIDSELAGYTESALFGGTSPTMELRQLGDRQWELFGQLAMRVDKSKPWMDLSEYLMRLVGFTAMLQRFLSVGKGADGEAR
jgi:hypothetical protein